ncbi:H-NS histone family protein [Methylomonas sp. EFPC1]|uniref:H-NS family nucleoid-associated regulatory protein n=1 Tax=Methylomonas sp. EFPC1 TaxID=2812647 RepID=UPI0019679853|nr:H-NS family nucleoid-associated regulatory protein [Methylomonas sp. EFPC1]QSB03034.1 H-NS histone family protein [Methylomonas sp. EFPC1]
MSAKLEDKSISELQALFESTQKILLEKQSVMRDSAVEKLQQIAKEAGIKIFIRLPKKKETTQPKTYRHPQDKNLVWQAKPGQKPSWLRDLLKNGGHTLEELEVKDQAS